MSIVNPSILPGFMELLPEEQIFFDRLKKTIEDNFVKYGYFNLDTPLIEKQEILLSKGGGETSKQIYKIDKESTPQALRFDLTVSLARYVSMYAHDLTFPFKRYQIGKVYRGERNQKGRYREFYQCDIDIIGNEKLSILNDAEITSVIYNIFSEMGFRDLVLFRINNRKLLSGFLESLAVENFEATLRTIDKLEKIGREKTEEELMSNGLNKDQVNALFDFIDSDNGNEATINKLSAMEIDNEKFVEGRKELLTVYEYMKKFAVAEESIKIDLTITRGLDYYTGTVLETFLKGYETIGSVCSGGRYEDLASNFSKQKYPGIGLSIGLTRLFYQLNEAGLLNREVKAEEKVLIIPMDDENLDYAIETINELRNNEIKSEIYLEEGKTKKKFAYADKQNIKKVIIIGKEEMENRTLSVKDFTTGDQETIQFVNLVSYFNGGNWWK